MISYREDEQQKLIELYFGGTVTKGDFETAPRSLEPRHATWRDINMLEAVENYDGIELQNDGYAC